MQKQRHKTAVHKQLMERWKMYRLPNLPLDQMRFCCEVLLLDILWKWCYKQRECKSLRESKLWVSFCKILISSSSKVQRPLDSAVCLPINLWKQCGQCRALLLVMPLCMGGLLSCSLNVSCCHHFSCCRDQQWPIHHLSVLARSLQL